jgi:hypothetical protein
MALETPAEIWHQRFRRVAGIDRPEGDAMTTDKLARRQREEPFGAFRPFLDTDRAYYPVTATFAMIRQDDFETIIVTKEFVARIYEPDGDGGESVVTVNYLSGNRSYTTPFSDWDGR